jgi:hypothetical protein
MRATHFLMKTLPRVAAEMALHVLAHNLTRVINIVSVQPSCFSASAFSHNQDLSRPTLVIYTN